MGKLWNKETLELTTQSPYNATFSGLERVAKGARRNGTRWRSGPTNATASQRSSSVIQLSHLLSWLSLKASDMATLFQIEEDLVSAKVFSVWVQCQAFMSSPMSSILLKCRKPCLHASSMLCWVSIVFFSHINVAFSGLMNVAVWASNNNQAQPEQKIHTMMIQHGSLWQLKQEDVATEKKSMSKGLEDYMIQWCIILSQLQWTTSWYCPLPVQSGLLSQRAREDVTDLGRFWLQ